MICVHEETGLQVVVRKVEHKRTYESAATGKKTEVVTAIELVTEAGQPCCLGEPDDAHNLRFVSVMTNRGLVSLAVTHQDEP